MGIIVVVVVVRMVGEGSARGGGWVDGEAVWGRGWHGLEVVERKL